MTVDDLKDWLKTHRETDDGCRKFIDNLDLSRRRNGNKKSLTVIHTFSNTLSEQTEKEKSCLIQIEIRIYYNLH